MPSLSRPTTFRPFGAGVLNVALLIPETQRATRSGLVGALNDHYVLPGRLADYRRKFERTVRRDGEDASIFAIELETLAVRIFGDMGPSARVRMIRKPVCYRPPGLDLWRHLDSVPPDTPIRDIVDICRVWESHADVDDRRHVKPTLAGTRLVCLVSDRAVRPVDWVVAAVTTPVVGLADLETLVQKLLLSVPAPV